MTPSSNMTDEIKKRIEATVPDSQASVIQGGDRHYTLTVISNVFEGMPPVKQQQLVYSAITDLMSGNDAPIHAIDKMNIQIS